MKSALLLIVSTLFFYSSTQAQITFSDPNLKAALIGLGLDKNSNTAIEINEIDTLKRLYVNSKAINNFNDLIHFPSLERLYCAGNKMNDLDLSHNLQLKYLQAAGMDLNFIDLSKNSLLDTLEIFNNKLIAIDISANTNLTSINCNNNQLASLDLSLNTQLQHVALSQNFLTSLNTSTLLNLKHLYCDDNTNLTTLNLLNNSQLELLVCLNNSMNELILSGNPKLITLACGYNSLNYIGLKNQTNLKELSAQNNNIQFLDFSANTKLTSLNLNNNNFSSIDLMPIVSLSNLQITGNPSLLKICINDTTSAKTNVSFFKDASAKYNSCDYIAFQDVNFKAALKSYKSPIIDVNNDGEFQYSEVANIVTLNIANKNISNLIDLNYFKKLKTLNCKENKIPDLDLIVLDSLTDLDCSISNYMTSLKIKNFPNLKTINAQWGKIATFEVADTNKLISLDLSHNNINTIDLSTSPNLVNVDLRNNLLTNISITDKPFLTSIYVSGNVIQKANFKNNTALQSVDVQNNLIDSLELTSLLSLVNLNAYNNKLVYLNLPSIDFMSSLDISTNKFYKKIDLTAVKNINIKKLNNNPDLKYICINPGNSTAIPNLIDATAKWTYSCDIIEFKDPNFKANLLAHTNPIIDVNKDGEIQISEVDTLKNLEIIGNIQGTPILSDVSELVYFKKLRNLSLPNHNLSSLGAATFDSLTNLNCSGNKIVNLDLYPKLQTLNCSYNSITSLNLSICKDLTYFEASSNDITNIDFSLNDKLTNIYVSNNKLTQLDLANQSSLLLVSANLNSIKKVNLMNATKLNDINLNDNQIDSIDVSTNINLLHLKCNNNLVSYLKPVSSLIDLALFNNKLTNKLDISTISNAYIIDLRANTALKYVCVNNRTNFSNNSSYRKDITAKWLDQCDFIEFSDTTLKHYLLVNNYDLNLDGEIQYSEAEQVKTIDFSHAGLSALEGLDKLINLESLLLNDNKFDNILFGTLTRLKNLVLTNNNLSNIDLTQNAALQSLDIKHNNLNTLEIGNQSSLETLDCSQNKLTALSLNSNLNLKSLYCYANNLSTLDFTFNSNLEVANCDTNNISTLEIQSNTKLDTFSCRANPNLSTVCIDSFDVVKLSANFKKDAHTQWTDYCNINPRLAPNYSYCLNQPVDTSVFPIAKKNNIIKWYSDQDALMPAQISTLKVGNAIYYISEYNPFTHKVSKRNKVTITTNDREVAPIVDPLYICLNTLVTSGITPSLGVGYIPRWYADETSNDTIAAPIPVTTKIDTLPYYFTQYKGTSCESFRAKIEVIIKPLPARPSIDSLSTYCHQAVPQPMLADPLCQLQWWNSEQNGIMNQQYQPLTTIVGLSSYYVNQKNTITGCESPRKKIQFEVIPSPSKPAFPYTNFTPQYIKDTSTTFKTSISNYAIKYKWIVSPAGAAMVSDSTNKATVKWNSTYSGNASVKVVSIAKNGCLSDTSNHVSITKIGVARLTVDKPNFMLYLNDTATIQLALTGAGPFSISYTYAGKDTSIVNYSAQLYTVKVTTPGTISDILVQDSSKVILQNIGEPFTLTSDTLNRIELSKIQTICKNAPSKLIVNLTGGRAPFTCYLIDTINGYKTQYQLYATDTVAIRAGTYKITFEDATHHISNSSSIVVADSINQDFAVLKTIMTTAGLETDLSILNSSNAKTRFIANVNVKDLAALYKWSIVPKEAIVDNFTESSDYFVNWNRHFSGEVKVAVQGYKLECKTQTSDTLKLHVKPNVEVQQINDSLVKFKFYGAAPYSVRFSRDIFSDSIIDSEVDSVFIPLKFAENIIVENIEANTYTNNLNAIHKNINFKPIKFYDGISPNNDGKNEAFCVDYYDLERASTLYIYTYDGFNVFTSKGDRYKNDWSGKDEKGIDLPSNNYLFIFKSDNNTYRGSFEIRR